MASQTRLKPEGLAWLAERDPERWIRPSKGERKIRVKQLAADAGIGRVSLHEMLNGHRAPGREMQDRLRDLAVSTGVSHSYAQEQLFTPVEIDEIKAAA